MLIAEKLIQCTSLGGGRTPSPSGRSVYFCNNKKFEPLLCTYRKLMEFYQYGNCPPHQHVIYIKQSIWCLFFYIFVVCWRNKKMTEIQRSNDSIMNMLASEIVLLLAKSESNHNQLEMTRRKPNATDRHVKHRWYCCHEYCLTENKTWVGCAFNQSKLVGKMR